MAVKTLYFKNAAPSGASGSLSLQDGGTAPATGITATGWTVAKLATPNFSAMVAGTKRASGTFSSTDALGSFSAAAGFRSEQPISGSFANTAWSMAFRIRAVSAVSAQTGAIKVHVWKSTNADGSGASQVSGTLTGTTTAVLSTTASAASTVTWSPGVVTLNNEYLWVDVEWSIVATSGSNSSDAVLYIESAGAITTPNFVAAYTMPVSAGAFSLSGKPVNLTGSGIGKLFYFRDAIAHSSTTALSLREGGTPPGLAITSTGWTVGKLAASNYCGMVGNSKMPSVLFLPSDQLSVFQQNQCWRTEDRFNGTFDNDYWFFIFGFLASASANGQTGKIGMRIWKSADPTGVGATQLTAGTQFGGTTAAMSTTSSQGSIITWSPGASFTFNDEYLWVQCEWVTVAPGGDDNADVMFTVETGGTVQTPKFLNSNIIRRMPVYTGAFTLSGKPVDLSYHSPNNVMPVSTGAFTLSGKPVNLTVGSTQTESTIFSTTMTTNSPGWGGYAIRSVVPVTGMADAAFLVVILDLGATADLRMVTGLGTIDGPGDGAMAAYAGPPYPNYEHAVEMSGKLDGSIVCVTEIQLRGSGATREVRVRLEGPNTTINILTAGIGIWNGTNNPNSPYMGSTAFTPSQLKFSGAPNISLSGLATAYSDWTVLPDNIKGVYGPHNIPSGNSGWNGYTFVNTLAAANLRAAAGSLVRVGFRFGPSTAAGQVTTFYINQAAAAGDAYDFKPGTPARLTFGGNNSVTHDGVRTYLLSDWTPLPDDWDNSKSYAVSAQFSGGGDTSISYNNSIATSGSAYYKVAAEAALVDKTGYAPFFANVASFIEIIEVSAPSAPAVNHYTMAAATGAFNLAGTNTYLIYGTPAKVLTAATGAVTLTGSSATLRYAARLPVTVGAVSLNGRIAGLRAARAMPVIKGTVTLAGTTTGLRIDRKLPLTVGAFSLNGRTAGLRVDRKLPLTKGTFTLSGKNADLVWSGSGAKFLVAATGPFALSGKTANLKYNRKGIVATGAFALTGNAVDLKYARSFRMPVTTGAFTMTRNPAVLRRGYVLRAGWGVPPTVFDPAHVAGQLVVASGLTVTKITDDDGSYNALTTLSAGTKLYAELLVVWQLKTGYSGFGVALPNYPLENHYPGIDTNSIGLYSDTVWYDDTFVPGVSVDPFVDTGHVTGIALDRINGTIQFRNITMNGAWSAPAPFPVSVSNAVVFIDNLYDLSDKHSANFDGVFQGKPPTGDYTRWNGVAIVKPVTLTGYPVDLRQGQAHDIVLHVATGTVLLSGQDVELRHKMALPIEKQPGPLNFGYANVYLNRW